jgi:hypothetical protein
MSFPTDLDLYHDNIPSPAKGMGPGIPISPGAKVRWQSMGICKPGADPRLSEGATGFGKLQAHDPNWVGLTVSLNMQTDASSQLCL